MKRVTPLNIVTSLILIWLGFNIIDDTGSWSKIILGLVMLVISLVADQLIRVAVGSLNRIWLVQMLFIAITVIAAFVIWYIRN